jgi:hypothetical protein
VLTEVEQCDAPVANRLFLSGQVRARSLDQPNSERGAFVSRLVQLRTDARVRDDAQLLVRFNDDADVANALRLALADADRYRALPGYAEHGAVTVSVFLVTGTTEARTLTAGIGQHLFGLTDAAAVRAAGFDVVATTIVEDGEPLPFSDRHADLIVAGYPAGKLPYRELSRIDRRLVRESLTRMYEQALRLFDPRFDLRTH